MPQYPQEWKERAEGCLMGQVAGDSLGSLVEFKSPEEIRSAYPGGVRRLENGGIWKTLAGQPTDDSEMALMLARHLAQAAAYDPREALRGYEFWMNSDPFDVGTTISNALRGRMSPDSQANGALMRISPLGIFGASRSWEEVARWAREDAALTHPHPVCLQANALYACLIAEAVRSGGSPRHLYAYVLQLAERQPLEPSLRTALERAADRPPDDFMTFQGWVLVAFQNALWQLLHAPDLETGVVDTVMRGGDTDTNAAICGALLGAVHGVRAVPAQWREAVLSCRPEQGRPGVGRPRPRCFWPVDIPELASRLLEDRRRSAGNAVEERGEVTG